MSLFKLKIFTIYNFYNSLTLA